MSVYSDNRYHDPRKEGIPQSVVDEEVERIISVRLAAVWKWAADPTFDPGDLYYYGDAQMHVLGLLRNEPVEADEWVEGRYVRKVPDGV